MRKSAAMGILGLVLCGLGNTAWGAIEVSWTETQLTQDKYGLYAYQIYLTTTTGEKITAFDGSLTSVLAQRWGRYGSGGEWIATPDQASPPLYGPERTVYGQEFMQIDSHFNFAGDDIQITRALSEDNDLTGNSLGQGLFGYGFGTSLSGAFTLLPDHAASTINLAQIVMNPVVCDLVGTVTCDTGREYEVVEYINFVPEPLTVFFLIGGMLGLTHRGRGSRL